MSYFSFNPVQPSTSTLTIGLNNIPVHVPENPHAVSALHTRFPKPAPRRSVVYRAFKALVSRAPRRAPSLKTTAFNSSESIGGHSGGVFARIRRKVTNIKGNF